MFLMNQSPITVDFRRKKIFKNFVKTDRSVINNFSSHRPRPENEFNWNINKTDETWIKIFVIKSSENISLDLNFPQNIYCLVQSKANIIQLSCYKDDRNLSRLAFCWKCVSVSVDFFRTCSVIILDIQHLLLLYCENFGNTQKRRTLLRNDVHSGRKQKKIPPVLLKRMKIRI